MDLRSRMHDHQRSHFSYHSGLIFYFINRVVTGFFLPAVVGVNVRGWLDDRTRGVPAASPRVGSLAVVDPVGCCSYSTLSEETVRLPDIYPGLSISRIACSLAMQQAAAGSAASNESKVPADDPIGEAQGLLPIIKQSLGVRQFSVASGILDIPRLLLFEEPCQSCMRSSYPSNVIRRVSDRGSTVTAL